MKTKLLLFFILFYGIGYSQIYVDINATGNNDGTSWANAYTNLNTALSNNPAETFWVASGNYIPGNLNTSTFSISLDQKIYGGFNGTETIFTQRDVITNETIISGDIDGNDAVIFNPLDPNKADNSFRVITIVGANVIIDGFTITNGKATFSTGGYEEGPAIYKAAAGNLEINNCKITNHIASRAGVIRAIDTSGDILVKNSVFSDNETVFATIFYGRNGFMGSLNTKFEGCLFYNNVSTTNTGGSLFWARQDVQGNQTLEIINSTLTNNTITNGSTVITCTNTATVVNVYNSIFWNNVGANNSNVNALQTNAVGESKNNISNNGFIGNSNTANNLTADPFFINPSNNNYSILGSSPAVNNGDNIYVTNTTDLSGAQRIINTTVDIGAYEITPDPCDPFAFSTPLVAINSFQLEWQTNPVATSWDVAYHESSQPFSSAIQITGLTVTNATISNIMANTQYQTYVRSVCNGVTGNWILATITTTQVAPIYVAKDATGTNDGTSWANAYTDLANALALNPSNSFWVKTGSYNPGSNLTDSFLLSQDQHIYGGFVGTETSLSQRNTSLNQTVLTGDVNSNDVMPVVFGDASLSDNNYQVIKVGGTNIIIDGFTITGGNANGNGGSDNAGSAVLVTSATTVHIVDCKVINNTGTGGGVIKAIDVNGNVNIAVARTTFDSNIYTNTPIYYGRAANGRLLEITFESCLITNNESKTTVSGSHGALFWTRQDVGGTQIITFTNSTITDNTINNGSSVVATILNNGGNLSTNMYNSIVWNNVNSSNTPLNAIETVGAVIIRNSLSNNNFPGHSNKQNTLSSDPLFTDSNIDNYTLLVTSPALNAGDSQFINVQTDLEGNNRISGTSVDIGAYEIDDNSVVVPFVDANFKAALVGDSTVNLNGDTEIQVSEAQVYSGVISVPNQSITSLGGIEFFPGITSVNASNNSLTDVDLSSNNLITEINVENNQLSSANFGVNTLLTDLNLSSNAFTTIDVSNYTSLLELNLSNNSLNQLSIFNNSMLTSLNVSNNMLAVLNVKNGNNTAITTFDATMNSPLTCIEVNDLPFANANWTSIDSQTSFSSNCVPQIYLDVQATGSNDGSSWADAYVDLETALADNPAGEFWMAAGRYVVANGSRSNTYEIGADQKIYGGFDGTETNLTQRNPATNIVILDGDRDNDDGTVFLDHNSSNSSLGSDNVYHVITIIGNNVIIDGVTIKGGNANGGTSEDRRGSAIDIKEDARTLTVNDVRFNYNRVFDGGIIFGTQSTNTNLSSDYMFTNCVFDRNLGRFAAIFYYANPLSTAGVNSTFVNCLIFDNRVTSVSDYPGSTTGASSLNSLFWLRSDVAGGINNGKFINMTISQTVFNNNFPGTPTAGLISGTRVNGTTNIELYNSILWNNGSNNVAVDTQDTFAPANSVIIRNSLSQDNFSNQSNTMSILNSNPNFSNEAANDFTLNSNSPSIDTGGNQYFPSNVLTDLVGNARIFNSIVDMGAYESVSTLSTTDFELNTNEISLYPNPTSSILNIKSKQDVETVTIYSVLGKKVLKAETKTIDVSNLSQGIYIMKIITKDNSETVKRFIKK
ncbi:choice-of-anchor Q domain-containing protein [Oceanihabitans sp. 2_MG-2023]|uniref:choice-of-anchor Q domain-containing protein n=1 Tax=Oceanihabitans sp. 2_MG-2023 TaxID=3062661 RepID=UPI0026E4348F|nr:choice-of-anchor Q domain-containing protein [Oceanihabitans sp. 2_MG-2023]MDO6597745.1 choice-of-anchor Q domain-containing protein [Oceanihabitans sp. 2_MG-2023]